VNGEEPLGLCHRFESPHVALARTGWAGVRLRPGCLRSAWCRGRRTTSWSGMPPVPAEKLIRDTGRVTRACQPDFAMF